MNLRHGMTKNEDRALIVFSGLPGVGKSTIAKELARQLNAVYVRIDSIEQVLNDSGTLIKPIYDTGYRVAHAITRDNLRLGRIVVADCVNSISLSRDDWMELGKQETALFTEVEVICSNLQEHRQRVETRQPDIVGSKIPTWNDVLSCEYEPWVRDHIVVDSAECDVSQGVTKLREILLEKGLHQKPN